MNGALAVGLVASVVAACSGDAFTAAEDSTGTGGSAAGSPGSGDGGAATADGSGGGTVAPPDDPPPAEYRCPASPPIANAVCSVDELYCSYGDDPRPSCRQRFLCDSDRWVTASAAACSHDATCPSPAPATGEECTDEDQVCAYPGAGIFCGCPPCDGFCTFTTWQCSRPGTGTCPALLPNDGQPCPSESDGRACEYGNCNLGDAATVHCIAGRWIWTVRECG